MSIDLGKPGDEERRLEHARDDLVAHIRGLPKRRAPPALRLGRAPPLLAVLVRGLRRHLLRRLLMLAAGLAAAQFLLPGGIPDLAFVPEALWRAAGVLQGR